MDPLQELLAIKAIEALKARYVYCADVKDWDGWGACLTEDATFEADNAASTMGREPMTTPVVHGRAAIVEMGSQGLGNAQTAHHIHSPIITLLSDTEATGLWAMEDIVEWEHNTLTGQGHYHDRYRKVDGQWQIASVRLTRLRVVFTQQGWKTGVAAA